MRVEIFIETDKEILENKVNSFIEKVEKGKIFLTEAKEKRFRVRKVDGGIIPGKSTSKIPFYAWMMVWLEEDSPLREINLDAEVISPKFDPIINENDGTKKDDGAKKEESLPIVPDSEIPSTPLTKKPKRKKKDK